MVWKALTLTVAFKGWFMVNLELVERLGVVAGRRSVELWRVCFFFMRRIDCFWLGLMDCSDWRGPRLCVEPNELMGFSAWAFVR